MAKHMLRDGSLVVNGVTLSDHVKSMEFSGSAEDVDVTAMGAVGVGRVPGLRDESLDVTFLQDYAAASVDATLSPLYTGGTSFTVVVKYTSAAVSATNPTFTATCYLLEYQAVAGDVGSAHEVSTTFVVDGIWTRATS